MTHIRYSIRLEDCDNCTVPQEECISGGNRCERKVVVEEIDVEKIIFEVNPKTDEIVSISLCAAEPVRVAPLLLKNIVNMETHHVLLSRRDMRGAKIYGKSVKHRDEFNCEIISAK